MTTMMRFHGRSATSKITRKVVFLLLLVLSLPELQVEAADCAATTESFEHFVIVSTLGRSDDVLRDVDLTRSAIEDNLLSSYNSAVNCAQESASIRVTDVELLRSSLQSNQNQDPITRRWMQEDVGFGSTATEATREINFLVAIRGLCFGCSGNGTQPLLFADQQGQDTDSDFDSDFGATNVDVDVNVDADVDLPLSRRMQQDKWGDVNINIATTGWTNPKSTNKSQATHKKGRNVAAATYSSVAASNQLAGITRVLKKKSSSKSSQQTTSSGLFQRDVMPAVESASTSSSSSTKSKSKNSKSGSSKGTTTNNSSSNSNSKGSKAGSNTQVPESAPILPQCFCLPPANADVLLQYQSDFFGATNRRNLQDSTANNTDAGIDAIISIRVVNPIESCPSDDDSDTQNRTTIILLTLQVAASQTQDGSLSQAQVDQLEQDLLEEFNALSSGALNGGICDPFFRRITSVRAQQKFPGYSRRHLSTTADSDKLYGDDEYGYVEFDDGTRYLQRNTARPTLDLSGFLGITIIVVIDFSCRRCPSGTNLYADSSNRRRGRRLSRSMEDTTGTFDNPRQLRSIIELQYKPMRDSQNDPNQDHRSMQQVGNDALLENDIFDCLCSPDADREGVTEDEVLAALNITVFNDKTNGIDEVTQLQELQELDCSDSVDDEEKFELLVTIELQVCDASQLTLEDDSIPLLEQAFKDAYNELVAVQYCDPFFRIMQDVNFLQIRDNTTVPSFISGEIAITIQASVAMRCRGCDVNTTTLYEGNAPDIDDPTITRNLQQESAEPSRRARRARPKAKLPPPDEGQSIFPSADNTMFTIDQECASESTVGETTHPFDAHRSSGGNENGPQILSTASVSQTNAATGNGTTVPLIETCYCDAAPIAERSPSEPELMTAFNAKVQELNLPCIGGVSECPELTPFATTILIEFNEVAIGTDNSSLTALDISILVDDIVQLILGLYENGGNSTENLTVCDPSFRIITSIETTVNLNINNELDDSMTTIFNRYLFGEASIDTDEDSYIFDPDLNSYDNFERQLRTTSRPTLDLSSFTGLTNINIIVTGSCSRCSSYFGLGADSTSSSRRGRRGRNLHTTTEQNIEYTPPDFMYHHNNHRQLDEATPEEPSTCFCPIGSDQLFIFNVNDLRDIIDDAIDLPSNVTVADVQEILTVDCATNTSDFTAEPLFLDLSVKAGGVTTDDLQEFAALFEDAYNELAELYCDELFRRVDTATMIINVVPGSVADADGCVDARATVNSEGNCRGCVDGQSLVDADTTAASSAAGRRMIETVELELELNRKGRMEGGRSRKQRRRLELPNTCVCTSDAIAGRGPFELELYAALNRALVAAPIAGVCGLADSILDALPPTALPSSVPTGPPVEPDTQNPSGVPSLTPSSIPTGSPSEIPSEVPSKTPSALPSLLPSHVPTVTASEVPSKTPSALPSLLPSHVPTVTASEVPSKTPSTLPSTFPSASPSQNPTIKPSAEPSKNPSAPPSHTNMPQEAVPTDMPQEAVPTDMPQEVPTGMPR